MMGEVDSSNTTGVVARTANQPKQVWWHVILRFPRSEMTRSNVPSHSWVGKVTVCQEVVYLLGQEVQEGSLLP